MPPRVGDTGIKIDIITNVDITGVLGVRFDVRRPDNTETSWFSGTAVISGTGQVRYITSGNNLSMVGEFVIAPFFDFSATHQIHTPAVRMQVHPVFQP